VIWWGSCLKHTAFFLLLVKAHKTSNASRKIIKPLVKYSLSIVPRSLKKTIKSESGRNSIGRKVCFTKTSRTFLKCLPVVTYRFSDFFFGMSCAFKLNYSSTKLFSLIYTLEGTVLYLPTSSKDHKFFYYYKKPFSNKTGVDLSNPSISQICQLSHMAEVSNVESFSGHGSKYVRSSGTRAILISFNMENHTALLQMPSGASKSFSIYSLALIGPSALKVRRQFRNTKSGYWRSIGHKPKVRGVARNPVDHPHGGRTKSIRYPRTPWGKTTKYK